ncbi:hypothetical protein Aduo_018898 [Ancylostoma duodenale]
MAGRYRVLVYNIPGQSLCYSFSFHKKKRFPDSYRCVQCQVGGVHVRVDVNGDEFQCDPCMLPHRCIPRRWITNSVERFLYERTQEIRKDPKYADAVVRKLWQDMLDTSPTMSDLSKPSIFQLCSLLSFLLFLLLLLSFLFFLSINFWISTLEEVRALMNEFHDYGYEKRRRQIARNAEKHEKPKAMLDDVLERLRTLMDGSNFLQYSSSGLYIYYSKETIKAAVVNGLTALVADGIHKLPPEELGESGQPYTVHGICNADKNVPIFHVLTYKKIVTVYAKVFGVVKQELQALGVDTTTLRIILDFEKAALAGIKLATATLLTYKTSLITLLTETLTYGVPGGLRLPPLTSLEPKSTLSRHKGRYEGHPSAKMVDDNQGLSVPSTSST